MRLAPKIMAEIRKLSPGPLPLYRQHAYASDHVRCNAPIAKLAGFRSSAAAEDHRARECAQRLTQTVPGQRHSR